MQRKPMSSTEGGVPDLSPGPDFRIIRGIRRERFDSPARGGVQADVLKPRLA